MVFRGKRVVGVGVPQFCNAPDVTGVEFRNLGTISSLAYREVIQLLSRASRCVVHVVAVRDGPRVDPEVAHIAYVGLGDGFEYLSDERTLVFRMDFHGPIALGALEGVHFFHLVRIGHELHDCGEHSLHTHVELTRNAEEWE